MKGETVLDPFGGLMTVPFRAVRLGRKGVGIELNATYWQDGVKYCEAAERETATPSLFDFLDAEGPESAA
jgi:DNA modification methylase